MNKDKAIAIRLSKKELECLEREAKKRDVPMSQIVREGLRKVLNLDLASIN